MAYGGMMGQAPQGVAPINGLPTNDVRELTVRSGYDISAGDVVDVEGGEVFKNVHSQPPVARDFESLNRIQNDSAVVSANNAKSFVAYCQDSKLYVCLVDNVTGTKQNEMQIATFSSFTELRLKKLKNNACVLYYSINSGCFIKCLYTTGGNTLYEGQTLSLNSIPAPCGDIIPISEDKIILIDNFSTNTLDLVCNLLTVQSNYSIQKHPSTSGTGRKASQCAIDLVSHVGNIYKICVLYTDPEDGNKLKSFITNYDSSKSMPSAITLGNTTQVTTGTTSGFSLVCKNNKAYCTFFVSSTIYWRMKVLSITGNTIEVPSTPLDIGKADSFRYKSCTLNTNGTIISMINTGQPIDEGNPSMWCFVINDDSNTASRLTITDKISLPENPSGDFISADNIGENKIMVFYPDAKNNSGYGRTTILEVQSNQIAGSFTSTSKDAIALQSASSGQPISVGFGGYCPCDGITEGQTITSSGVMGYGVQDGWLDVRPEYENSIVTGGYIGDGSKNRKIDIGFTPKSVSVYNVGEISSINDAIFPLSANEKGLSYQSSVLLQCTNNGFIISHEDTSYTKNRSNISYGYIAFR